MIEFTPSQVTDLAEHIRKGNAIAKHDIGYLLPDILDTLLAKINYLERILETTPIP